MKTESEQTASEQQEKNLSKNDQHLTQTIANTLDKSLQTLDDLSLLRLKQSRIQALAYSSASKRPWLPMSIAASIIMLAAVPLFWQKGEVASPEGIDSEIISQDVPFVVQDMDDMEMLIAMDDIDA